MKTREQVKKGTLSLEDAMKSISPASATYKWCQRRLTRKSITKSEDAPAPKNRKYRHRPKH